MDYARRPRRLPGFDRRRRAIAGAAPDRATGALDRPRASRRAWLNTCRVFARIAPLRRRVRIIPKSIACAPQERVHGREVTLGSAAEQPAEGRGVRLRPGSRPGISGGAPVGDSGGRLHRLDSRHRAGGKRRGDSATAASCSPSAISSLKRRALAHRRRRACHRRPSARRRSGERLRPGAGARRLDLPALDIGRSSQTKLGDPVIVAAGGRAQSVRARIIGKQEFAGYWEYR